MTTSAALPMQLWLGYWRYRRIYHRYSVEGLEHLDGPPALIVGYHGRGLAYDLCMLTVTLYERFGYLPRTLVHRGVEWIPPLKWLSDGLGFVTGDGHALAAAVAQGQHVITAPGGTAEACRSFRDRYRVSWGDHVGYLRLALKHGLRIVPVAAAGVDDTYIGLNGGPALGRRLGLPRDWAWALWIGVGPIGVWPFSPPFPARIRQLIGEAIDVRASGVRADDRDALLSVHREITASVQALLDRARGAASGVPVMGNGRAARTAAAPPGLALHSDDGSTERRSREGEDRTRRQLTMSTINDLLPEREIATLRAAYDRDKLNERLRGTFSNMYAATSDYIKAISSVFFELPDDIMQQPPDKLSAANRERCLIAMLAARGGGFPLATHVYIGLMEGFKPDIAPQDDISPEEIANMIFLAGVYSGADNLIASLVTLNRTLGILHELAIKADPAERNQDAVFRAITSKFLPA
jgi:1-acyl-sn-glycerol-3-phosphate acyltransferase/alkylhydroperoxidase/carboxymuconolactone decarboxylase family protein YurZ